MKKAICIVILFVILSLPWVGYAIPKKTDLFYAEVVSYNYWVPPDVLNRTPEDITMHDLASLYRWMGVEDETLAREIVEKRRFYPDIWLRCELSILTAELEFVDASFKIASDDGIWMHDFYWTYGMEEEAIPQYPRDCSKPCGAVVVMINIEGKSEEEIAETLRQKGILCTIEYRYAGSKETLEMTIPANMSRLHRDTRQDKEGYRIEMTNCTDIELVDVNNQEELEWWRPYWIYPIEFSQYMQNVGNMKFYRCRVTGMATKSSPMRVINVTFYDKTYYDKDKTVWVAPTREQGSDPLTYHRYDMYEDGVKEIQILLVIGVPAGSDLQTEIRKLNIEAFYAVDWVGYFDFITLTGPSVSATVDMSKVEVGGNY